MIAGSGPARSPPPEGDPSAGSPIAAQPDALPLDPEPFDGNQTGAFPSQEPQHGAAQGPEAGTVLSTTLTICNRRGLHARAAARFVTLAERFGASVDVIKDGQAVSARSIMGLMMLGAGIGNTIELRAEGWDAKEALEALASLVEAGFHEQD
jgi:phosphocarrier protein HPr